MARFLIDALGAFVGTGVAVIVAGYLSRSWIEHRLARALAEHVAKLETQETGKRAAIQRLDRDRAEFVSKLTKLLARFQSAFGKPITAKPGAEPVVVYMQRCSDLAAIVDSVRLITAEHSHLLDGAFKDAEFAWETEARDIANTFTGNILGAVITGFWDADEGKQFARLYPTFAAIIGTPQPAFSELQAACRVLAGTDFPYPTQK